LLENSIIIAYVGFAFVGMLYHEMWIDELQAWMIVRESSSLVDLYRNMSYEGHPFVWYFCLYVLSRFTSSPYIMQIFHLLITTCVVVTFTKFSPFSLLQKFCFAFGYFSLFEYGVITRSYSLGVLLVFLFCATYCRNRKSYLLGSAILALLANIHVFALILSGVLSLLLLTDALADLKSIRQQRSIIFSPLAGAGLLISSWLIAILQMTRPVESEQFVHDNVVRETGLTEQIKYFASTLNSVWRSHVPVPMTGETDFWNTNIVTSNEFLPSFGSISLGDLIAIILSCVLVAATCFFLSKKPVVTGVYLLGTALVLSINYLYNCELRHFGHLFILALACFWITESKLDSLRRYHPASLNQTKIAAAGSFFLSLLLSIQMIAGVYSISMDLLYPFSYSRTAAAYIRNNDLIDLPLIGEDRDASSISGYLNRPMYYLIRREIGTFWKGTTPAIQSEPERIALIQEALEQLEEAQAVLVLTHPISLSALGANTVKSLANFGQPLAISNEEFFLYLVQKENTELATLNKLSLALDRNGN